MNFKPFPLGPPIGSPIHSIPNTGLGIEAGEIVALRNENDLDVYVRVEKATDPPELVSGIIIGFDYGESNLHPRDWPHAELGGRVEEPIAHIWSIWHKSPE